MRRHAAIIAGWRLLAGMRSISSWRQPFAASARSLDWYSWPSAGAESDTRQSIKSARNMDHPPGMPHPGYTSGVIESPRLEALGETVAVCWPEFVQRGQERIMKIGFVGLG